MSFLDELEWRGLIQDCSDREGIQTLKAGDLFYCGFDPTATSLQAGNLVPIISMARLAQAGLKPIVIFGGATGAIGDPSGKSEERNLLGRETIDANIARQSEQMQRIFSNLGHEPEFTNNFDWLASFSLLDFLRDVGKHYTVNWMLAKESVKQRIEGGGLSFTEFSYMLLQGYDFYHLHHTRGLKLQIGGSDQWGNLVSGLELIRRKCGGEAYALTFPLVTDSDGKKLGKTEAGAIWLDPERTSPYQFHQYWLNVSDDDAIRFLKMFTFLTRDEIDTLAQNTHEAPEERAAQSALADALCDIVHGTEATVLAKRSAEVLFGGSLDGLAERDLLSIFSHVPSSSIARGEIDQCSFVDVLVQSGLASSKGEARRLVKNGGAYLNNERVSDAELSMASVENTDANLFVLRSGKKKYHLPTALHGNMLVLILVIDLGL